MLEKPTRLTRNSAVTDFRNMNAGLSCTARVVSLGRHQRWLASKTFIYRSGFTLVEMLVSIAIVATLAVLLVSAATSARKTSVNAKCISNMRQTGNLLMMMLTEHSGNPPIYFYTPSVDEGTWFSSLIRLGYSTQAEMERIAICPSLKNPPLATSFFCYGMVRTKLIADLSDPQTGARNTTLAFRQSETMSSCILLADSITLPQINWSPLGGVQILFAGVGGDSQGGTVHFRHAEKANVFFLDGHINSLSPQQLRETQLKYPTVYHQDSLEYAQETLTNDKKAVIKTLSN